MLQLRVDGGEFFNDTTEEFYDIKPQKLVLEHSLLSVSKWESKLQKPFLTTKFTNSEFIEYIKCMTINTQVNPMIYLCITDKHIKEIDDYINNPMTATIIRDPTMINRSRNRIITNELIYYWMLALNIPTEYEKWHLNRLMTLIKICSIENDPKKKKMPRSEIYKQNAALNAARRAKAHSKG